MKGLLVKLVIYGSIVGLFLCQQYSLNANTIAVRDLTGIVMSQEAHIRALELQVRSLPRTPQLIPIPTYSGLPAGSGGRELRLQ